MFNRVATSDQVGWVKDYVDTHDLGKRGVFDGDYYQQLFGLQGQIMITDLLGLPRPDKEVDCFDGGYDFVFNGFRWDVKVVLRSVRPLKRYKVNITSSQLKYDCDGYLFISYNRSNGVFSVLGWIFKDAFVSKAFFNGLGSTIVRDDGTSFVVREAAFYDLPIKELVQLNSLLELEDLGL